MRRREFLSGVSTISFANPSKQKGVSVEDALIILENAVRREIADLDEVRVAIEPDERKQIALLFSVTRCPRFTQL